MALTTNPLDALLYYRNGQPTWRWNFSEAEGGTSFKAGLGEAVRITYSFPTAKPGYATETGFRAFGSAEKAAALAAMKAIEKVCNVDFVEATSGVGQITFGYASFTDGAGYAWVPAPRYVLWSDGRIDDVNYAGKSGDVWISREVAFTAADWKVGGFGYTTLLHELGHALGLKHPFEGNKVLPTSLDHSGQTVMSYSAPPQSLVYYYDGVSVDVRYQDPTTPMPMDIQALQFLYGANKSGNAGDTVYKWAKNAELLQTIWDGQGIDTIDCGNQVLPCVINLAPGTFSSIAVRTTVEEILGAMDTPLGFEVDSSTYRGKNNLAIAKGTTIENATGGAGADRITGNTVANKLAGGLGNDTLSGGGGNDRLVGGGGNDKLAGGAGRDVLSGGSGNDLFDFNSKTELSASLTATDTVTDFVGGIDRIDLAGIDANGAVTGNQAFTFIGTRSFSADATGQLRFAEGVLYGSTDADKAAEFAIKLTGITALAATDLVL